MNWIDFIAAGGILAIAAAIVLHRILKRRRGGGRPCAGCPYADACAKNTDCPMKSKQDRRG